MNPLEIAALWVGVGIVCGVLGYVQGRRDEERDWLRWCAKITRGGK